MSASPSGVGNDIVAARFRARATREDIERQLAYQNGEHRHDAALCVEEGCARCAR